MQKPDLEAGAITQVKVKSKGMNKPQDNRNSKGRPQKMVRQDLARTGQLVRSD